MAVPKMTSSTSDGARCARSRAARPTISPRRTAGTSRRALPYFPMAVRVALTITTSVIPRGNAVPTKGLWRLRAGWRRAPLLERRGLVDLELLRLDDAHGAIRSEVDAVPPAETCPRGLQVDLLPLDRVA